MKEMVFAYPNYFIHGGQGCICPTQGEAEIKYLLQEGMSRKGSSLVKDCGSPGYLIIMETSRSLCYGTGRYGPVSGVVWSHAPGQETGWELCQTPTVLNDEVYQGFELAKTLPVLLSCYSVHSPTLSQKTKTKIKYINYIMRSRYLYFPG